MLASICLWGSGKLLTNSTLERRRLCLFTCILLPLVHLLFELLRLFLADEREAGEAFLEFEGVEKGAILVIIEGVIDFLIPYHTTIRAL